MCQTCLGGGFVQPYGSSVPLVPIGYGPVYFGVELEIECMGSDSTHSYARQIRPRYSDNFAIMKHDGSLNNGFEIVTRPASLMIHRDEWSKILNPTINGIRSYRTTTCGFHVHCSRRPLSEIQVAKIVCFVNAECNSKLIELIAGRVSDRWSRIAPKKLSDGNKANTERYEAVNLQNRETIEFRIFKGTLKYESLMKNIEFCDALIRYMAPASRMLQEYLDTEQFVRFALCERRFNKTLNRNVRRWPHLAAFLEAKWLNVKSASAEKYGFKRPDMKSAQTEEEI